MIHVIALLKFSFGEVFHRKFPFMEHHSRAVKPIEDYKDGSVAFIK